MHASLFLCFVSISLTDYIVKIYIADGMTNDSFACGSDHDADASKNNRLVAVLW